MAQNLKWTTPTLTTLLTTGLDGLTNGSEAESSAYDNSSNLDMYADFVLAICYGTAPAAGLKVAELYIEPTVDGTNYPSVTSGGLPQKALLIGALESVLPSTSVVEYLVLLGVPIPPGSFKILLSNTSGQTLKDNSVAKTLKMRAYKLQSA